MITYFDSRYLVSLSFQGVRVFGRAFATEQLARSWEQDALDAIASGLPLPDERDGGEWQAKQAQEVTSGGVESAGRG